MAELASYSVQHCFPSVTRSEFQADYWIHDSGRGLTSSYHHSLPEPDEFGFCFQMNGPEKAHRANESAVPTVPEAICIFRRRASVFHE